MITLPKGWSIGRAADLLSARAPLRYNRGVATRTPVLPARQVRIIAKALADPRRFDILKRIAAQQSCLGCADLLAAFPITPATLSHHLKELEAAALIETHREGKFLRAQFLRSTWDAYLSALRKI